MNPVRLKLSVLMFLGHGDRGADLAVLRGDGG
jgi:hypothetical protein